MSAAAVERVVRERPILFSGPMVRAVLDGKKSQTRRVVLPQPTRSAGLRPAWHWQTRSGSKSVTAVAVDRFASMLSKHCPYGQPGDRLWVRETFAPFTHEGRNGIQQVLYKADEDARTLDGCDDDPTELFDGPWSPSIFMRRHQSRITLELTDVRVERLQDISEDDARAEGCEPPYDERPATLPHQGNYIRGTCRGAYHALWDSLNCPRGYGWDVNPFVWVLSFRRIAP